MFNSHHPYSSMFRLQPVLALWPESALKTKQNNYLNLLEPCHRLLQTSLLCCGRTDLSQPRKRKGNQDKKEKELTLHTDYTIGIFRKHQWRKLKYWQYRQELATSKNESASLSKQGICTNKATKKQHLQPSSVLVLAEPSFRSPRKYFVFIIKIISTGSKYPKNILCDIKIKITVAKRFFNQTPATPKPTTETIVGGNYNITTSDFVLKIE